MHKDYCDFFYLVTWVWSFLNLFFFFENLLNKFQLAPVMPIAPGVQPVGGARRISNKQCEMIWK